MCSLKAIFNFISHERLAPVTDNAPPINWADVVRTERSDPYLTQSFEALRACEAARLITAVEGNPAAVLNVLSACVVPPLEAAAQYDKVGHSWKYFVG